MVTGTMVQVGYTHRFCLYASYITFGLRVNHIETYTSLHNLYLFNLVPRHQERTQPHLYSST